MKPLHRLRATLLIGLSIVIFSTGTPAVFGESVEQLQEVRDLLEKYHLSKPGAEELNEAEIDDMVDSLKDPYTEYFDAEEWKTFNSSLEHSFVGIGIVMGANKDSVYINDVIPGSPAEASGLSVGDVLLSGDELSFTGKSMAEIQESLHGVEGTSLILHVSRNGKELKFSVPRQAIQLPIITTQMLGDGVGYLSLAGFTSDAGKQVKNKLTQLEKQGMSSLVLDLRNNGGGYVTAAQEIAGLFIKEGVLAHMRDRDGNDKPLVVKGGTKPYEVVILVNGYSASASELLAGAMQDYGVATIVGTKSYGKGVVQSIVPLNSGGMLKITIEEYYTPKGRKVDKVGLKPDLVLQGEVQQFVGAFHSAGGKQVALSTKDELITINGIQMVQPGIILRQTNGWHINTRLAAFLLGADLKYNAKTKIITLTKGSNVHAIKTNDSHLSMINGSTSIHMGLLKKWYSNVSYSPTPNSADLMIKKLR